MARRKGKAVDKWKQKAKYKILAPKDYEYKELGLTMSDDPSNLSGRTISVSMRDVTGDKAKQHQNLVFELIQPEGKGVHTKFKRYVVARSYLSSMVREGSSKIDFVHDLQFTDDKIRVKIVVTTRGHSQSTQKKEIIKKMSQIMNAYTNGPAQNFVQLVITGKLGNEMYQNIKNICPIGRLEISEVSVL